MALPPENYFKIGPYLDVFQGIHTALDINEGIIKVVGPDGAGKSSFCLKLVEELQARGQEVIYFEQPPESSDYLYQLIQSALGLDKNKDFNRALTRYLQETSATHKLVIIYNDAEKISKDLFILIRLLNNIHDHSATLVSQIIVGTSKLDELFDDPALRSLTQYLNQSFTLPPMSRIDLDDFYTSYKNAHGITGKDMTNKELTDLFIRSKGLPGKTAKILDNFFRPEEVSQKKTIPVLTNTEKPVETVEHDTSSQTSVEPVRVSVKESQTSKPSREEPDFLQNLSLLPDAEPEAKSDDESVALSAADKTHAREKAQTKGRHLEEERKKQKQKETSASAAITETVIMHDTVLPPLGASETAQSPAISGHHARELDEILQRASTTPIARGPLYFKVSLSVVVIITSMILAFVLSGESDAVNNKVAKILAIDAPLYLDEVSNNTASTAPVTPPNLATNPVGDQNNTAVVTDDVTDDVTDVGTDGVTMAIPPNKSSVPVTTGGVNDDGNNRAADNDTEELPAAFSATATIASSATTDDAPLIPANSQQTVAQELPESEPVRQNDSQASALIQNAANGVLETPIGTGEAGDPTENPAINETIDSAINDWLAAWQEGRFEDYLAAYHDEFIPSYHESYGLWLEQRRARIQGVTGISLSFDRLEYIDSSATEATVEFWLQYTRGSYADDTHKQLMLKQEGDGWLIVAERNIEVIRRN